jgi:hypothetical protein
MAETFSSILVVGGKSNSLGRTDEVIELVLDDRRRLEELYGCTFDEDAWVRMRAIDAIEKIGRQKPDWLVPYIDKFQSELAPSDQPSILWHLAQMYRQISLTPNQKTRAITWLSELLSTPEIDWIVAANCMKTLVQFANDGSVPTGEAVKLIQVQQGHKSKTVVRTANKLLAVLTSRM